MNNMILIDREYYIEIKDLENGKTVLKSSLFDTKKDVKEAFNNLTNNYINFDYNLKIQVVCVETNTETKEENLIYLDTFTNVRNNNSNNKLKL